MKYLIAIILIMSAGCGTVIPTEERKVPSLSIVCIDPVNMGKILAGRIPYDPFAPFCSAYFDDQKGVIYVPWSGEFDIHGKPLPDFKALGHEMWHAVAGWWHGGTVFLPTKKNTLTFSLASP